ncbi:MAG TPA: hypothetical protein VJV78_14630 [Polyangiales bacterium]|nr:hypothetical protein [Polyangiales bacterium]
MTRSRARAATIALFSVALGYAGCADNHDPTDAAGNGGRSNLGFVPDFPGAGLSGADEPLPDGMVCDQVVRAPREALKPHTKCFFEDNSNKPSATIEQVLECAEGMDAVHLRLTFDPAFVDNTYGANAIGWDARAKGPGGPMGGMAMMTPPAPPPGAAPAPPAGGPGGGKMMMPKGMGPGGKAGHTWKDLVGSDHAEFVVTNEAGELVTQFKLDYVSVNAKAPSGYASLGVLGGDGKMIKGDSKWIAKWMTSIDRNLNERGYASYTEDSPETDKDYTPNDATPNWDYRVVYEVWIDNAAFGSSSFGGAKIEHVHASPSKAANDTLLVKPGDCPCQKDGGCGDTPPPKKECGGLDQLDCTKGDVPPPPDKPGPDCESNPDDPNCALE